MNILIKKFKIVKRPLLSLSTLFRPNVTQYIILLRYKHEIEKHEIIFITKWIGIVTIESQITMSQLQSCESETDQWKFTLCIPYSFENIFGKLKTYKTIMSCYCQSLVYTYWYLIKPHLINRVILYVRNLLFPRIC